MFRNLLWVTFLLICGCMGKERSVTADVSPAPAASDGKSNRSDKVAPAIADRKIIKEGELRFETSDMKKTRSKVETAIANSKGFISRETETSSPDRIEETLVIRVPAKYFDQLVREVSKGVERFDQKNINATDVTEEYMDVETRIRVKKEVENRYLALLEKAQSIEEILVIEKQLGELRAEIETAEGRLKYLENRVSLSTLTVVFYKKISVPVSVISHFETGLENGWNGLMWFLIGLVNLWPLHLAAVFVLLLIKIQRLRKRRRLKKQSDQKQR